MNYDLLRILLFGLNPELSHTLTLKSIRLLAKSRLIKYTVAPVPACPRTVFGLNFTNPIGLAAGLDKNGDYFDALGELGFGFIEVGTVTPKPQLGNPRPRLFRLSRSKALINRMGFNNKGVDHLVERVKKRRFEGILGINIGKNATTALENALDDYLMCLHKVYPHADYIVVNISSPNTPGLRELQGGDYLYNLLAGLKTAHDQLRHRHNLQVPMLIKIAPDLTTEDIHLIADACIEHKIDGVIATNTSLDRSKITHEPLAKEAGGLSGAPIFELSTDVLRQLKQYLKNHNIPLIGCGGIMTGEQAQAKIIAGADLVQIYTGLIYKGPDLISQCATSISYDKR